MKKVILWKVYSFDRLYGGWNWSIEEIYNDWDHVYSDPYWVEIPDDFYIGENMSGQKMFFRAGCDMGYILTIGRNCENGNPYLDGHIKLNVLGPVNKDELPE